MRLAHRIDHALGAAERDGAHDLAGRDQLAGIGAGDDADGAAPAHDGGDGGFVDAVLQAGDEAAGGEVRRDELRRPGRVVGFHADEGDVDRRPLRERLHVREVQRRDRHGDVLALLDAGQRQAPRADRLDMRRPGIDQRHVMAEPGQVAAEIAADRAGPDEGDTWTHSRFSHGAARVAAAG
jgi:hypothetical protein